MTTDDSHSNLVTNLVNTILDLSTKLNKVKKECQSWRDLTKYETPEEYLRRQK